jgi:hypothetical protein
MLRSFYLNSRDFVAWTPMTSAQPRILRAGKGGGDKPSIGAHSARATPVPMPNTAVKPRSGYNTWGSPLGK